MNLRPTLLKKVLLIASLNVLAVTAVFFALIRTQLQVAGMRFSPSRDKILAVARLLTIEMNDTDPGQWDALLQQYANDNRIDVRLVDETGNIVAGQKTAMPADIVGRFLEQTRELRGGHHRRQGQDVDDDLEMLAKTWVAVPSPMLQIGDPSKPKMLWLVLSSDRPKGMFAVDSTPFMVTGGVIVLISLAFWIPFVKGLTQTIVHMKEATAQIAEGQFGTQLRSKRRDELGDLAESIARMGSRLDLLVNGQKRFLRDAAHELRSPIARLQVALGLLERSSNDEQRKTIADLNEDAQQMGALVDALLMFSKAGMQAPCPQITDVEVEPIARRAIRLEGKGMQVSFVGEATLKVRADAQTLLRAFSNLVRNAIRYAGSSGPIEIDAQRDRESVLISVRDCGPGIPESDVDAVFEPFYRLQSARERNTGGVGLGLAIVKSDVEACGGSVRCRNRQPHGLEVEIRLPKGNAQA